MTELKLYKTPSKGLKLIGMSLPFVLIGIWMIFESPTGTTNYIMGWVSTCFFGLGIPIGLMQSFDKRPQIIINENGIWDRATKQDKIEWEQIVDAYPLDIFDQNFISIVSDDSFVFKKKPFKWAAKINKAIGAQNLNLHLSQINIEANKLTELIHDLKNAERKDRTKIIQSFNFRKDRFPLSSYLKIPLYISISIALLFLTLTGGITIFMTIMIIMGLSAITVRWHQGSSKKSIVKKYAGIITWFGMVNIALCLATLKTYDYVSESVGVKLSAQIDHFKKMNSSYPTSLNSIKEKADLNLIEELFANKIRYTLTEDDYELMTTNLLNKEKTYDQFTEEWN